MSTAETPWNDAFLNRMARTGDPLADTAVDELIALSVAAHESAPHKTPFSLLSEAISLVKGVKTNDALLHPDFSQASDPMLREKLEALVANCARLPSWTNLEHVRRAEELFWDSGLLSGVLFFSASLPEVYVAPTISNVLHATGHLERATEQRIRSTAAMILTVLLPGGLVSREGNGLVQSVKVRLIHASVRQALLHAQRSGAAPRHPPRDMYESLALTQWDPSQSGQPCNQEELAYTLLTFGYVFLRGLRRLGLGYAPADEEAYLHFWNVIGHLMGIDAAMMTHSMRDAEALFERLQARARTAKAHVDHRAKLGASLAGALEKSISRAPLKPLASLFMGFLTSAQTAADLGLHQRHNRWARVLFPTLLSVARLTDGALRFLSWRFSLVRLGVRIVGFQLLSKVLADPAHPLDLPAPIRTQVNAMIDGWSYDRGSPGWLNRIEDRFTKPGSWSSTIRV